MVDGVCGNTHKYCVLFSLGTVQICAGIESDGFTVVLSGLLPSLAVGRQCPYGKKLAVNRLLPYCGFFLLFV